MIYQDNSPTQFTGGTNQKPETFSGLLAKVSHLISGRLSSITQKSRIKEATVKASESLWMFVIENEIRCIDSLLKFGHTKIQNCRQ